MCTDCNCGNKRAIPRGAVEGSECSQAENRSYRLERETDSRCMDPHSPTCSPTVQPSQISCLTSLSSLPHVTSLPIFLLYFPEKRAKTIQLSTVEPASICNTGSQICEVMKKQGKIKNSTGEHWHVFHCSALQALRLQCPGRYKACFPREINSKSWQNEKQHLGRR